MLNFVLVSLVNSAWDPQKNAKCTKLSVFSNIQTHTTLIEVQQLKNFTGATHPGFTPCRWLISSFFFFFRENFNLWRPLLMIALYYQTKTLIIFWCRQGLRSSSILLLLPFLFIFYFYTFCRYLLFFTFSFFALHFFYSILESVTNTFKILYGKLLLILIWNHH